MGTDVLFKQIIPNALKKSSGMTSLIRRIVLISCQNELFGVGTLST